MNEWISVDDQLPKLKGTHFLDIFESDLVLVTYADPNSETIAPPPWIAYMHMYGDMKNPVWTIIGELGIGKVTHWMPLPALPLDAKGCQLEADESLRHDS